ncbi:FKBP-type peptidyl-prolyl cis-trans isomerase N-terminal domain-containing protein [Serratia sp. IR-2025]|nr:hypothetical protein SME23J_37030 [Serratia marcescens]
MITRYRLWVGMLLPLYSSGALADDGIPTLLQFAEKYQESQVAAESAPDKPPSPAENTPAQDKAPVRGPADVKKPTAAGKPAPASVPATAALQKTLQSQEAQLKEQLATIAQMEKQLADAKQAPVASAPDLQGLSKLAQQVRQALAITPGEQTAVEQMRQLRVREAESAAQLAAVKKDNAGLQAQMRSLIRGGEGTEKAHQQALEKQKQLQDNLEGIKQLLGSSEAVLTEKENTLTTVQQELATLQKEKEHATLVRRVQQQKLDTLTAEHTALQTDIVALRERAKWLVAPQMLKTEVGSQAYAAGVLLGRDIQSILDERKGWDMKTDPQVLLSGIIDTFTGQYQLTVDVLDKAMLAADRTAEQAREKARQKQQAKDENFLADFKKQKGVKQSPAGFWYRVDYVGDDAIPVTAIVDVVVKESLTDGKVIKDMDIEGKVLSQSLSEYPLLFREAISHLKNHGYLTMVVPPSLAYGEVGYPPHVPPNATMVYELRVDNSKTSAEP